ncbi:DUF4261 domain-containing protein [Peristeroidobacter agariperforans]|uniref:DUF4261 domain-containing protein n=1 Tax=Peristeroidobacter agariperforans TaxID=268404 RepID=UPI00101C9B0D|nr:DUF4261 domain-containing protein [Peristeroidobacter agariperforans]
MSIMISMILLRQPIELPASAIERELQLRYPDLDATLESTAEGIPSFKFKEGMLMLANMPAPIPWSELEGPCATSLLWKDAAEEVRRHESHILVTLMSEQNEVEQSVLLTKATAAVLAACDAMGVYWGNATLVIPKQIFLDFAEQVLPLGPPLDIWVDFRVGWQTKTASGGFTQGMEALGHMELETQESPEKPGDLRDRLQGVARYLLQNGPVIRDGDTVGQDAREKIRVIYSDSAFGNTNRVMRLQYETQAKPWWKLW